VSELAEKVELDFGPLAAADTIPPAPQLVGPAPVRRVVSEADIVA
jgi:hypothetical protein